MVTIDASGCQTAIVQALREAGADYLLAGKRHLHREVKVAFDDADRGAAQRASGPLGPPKRQFHVPLGGRWHPKPILQEPVTGFTLEPVRHLPWLYPNLHTAAMAGTGTGHPAWTGFTA